MSDISSTTQFSFGRNWRNFAQHLDLAQINEATAALHTLVGETLPDTSFLDIGCGSGLSSLAACRLGATHIVSFDYDPDSVATCRLLKTQYAPDVNWEILEGSILDPTFIATLDAADVVYSWGVLHHTGQMWQAIEIAASLVKPKGYLVIALYNQAPTSEVWLRIKKFYNRSNGFIQHIMVWGLFLTRGVIRAVRLRHPFRDTRGMSVYYDAVDWLGGLPYEYASPTQVHQFLADLGFNLVREMLTTHTGCNEFVFIRSSE